MNFLEILEKEPKFRQSQAKRALFLDLISDWNQATVFPKELREKLNREFDLKINAEIMGAGDSDKALITLKDGLKIETVLMKHDNRNTVCVSSQVGCPLGCKFCATGIMGFKRNLTAWEIIEQVLLFARILKRENAKITNIVFMGMGEPFLNYENVLSAIRILNDKEGFNLGSRHISISTAGIIEGIEKLAKENIQVKLAISLHAPNDKLRSELMPINKKYPIEKVLKSAEDFYKKTNKKVMLEYVMIKNINDSDACAKDLSEIAKKFLCVVNLVSYNPTGIFKSSDNASIKKFRKILENNGITVTQRFKLGRKIKGACGQLAGQ